MIKKILYLVWIIILAIFIILGIKSGNYGNFKDFIENKTFDLRQSFLINTKTKTHNKDIMIIAIDDASYEYILDKYGEWPLSRNLYADLVDFIEQQNPKSIAFDLMFVKSMKSESEADKKLVSIFKKYNNVYTAMNFDNQEQDIRSAAILPEGLALNVKNNSKRVDLDYYQYTNCRSILPEIISSTTNIGIINVVREDDGILRRMPLFVKYNGKYYPQLALKVALESMGSKDTNEFIIEKNGTLKLPNGKKIYLDDDGSVILNWYGGAETYENIPLYKVLNAMEKNDKTKFNFEGKTIYFGATASSLFDIKTVPVDRVYPGVEVQTTYVNNLLDGNIISKSSTAWNIITILILVCSAIIIVFAIKSMPVATALAITMCAGYIAFAYEIMKRFNIWIEIESPIAITTMTFVFALIIKYLIKSKDFDEQYKLATTDGLTDLYNHRYFQEQMRIYVQNAQRYNSIFSLIILDIDFFKQFNDNFGHQSGDAVLHQVGQELKRSVRATDIVCRYGGEEMSIILPNTAYDEAVAIANKLCKIISEKKLKLANNRESSVTISLGVSTYGDNDGKTPEEIISCADKRLYNAKNNGRNRVN